MCFDCGYFDSKGFHMSTCFLFVQDFADDYCLSLRVDDQGRLDAPLERRGFDAIRALQIKTRTIVVLPTEYCSLYYLELPRLNVNKARAALPYALEEHVAQAVSALHVAFDQEHYRNKHYLTAVIDRVFLEQLMTRLDDAMLPFDVITLDWFALNDGEVVVSPTSLLIHDEVFIGALTMELAAMYCSKRTTSSPITLFRESAVAFNTLSSLHVVDGSFYEWVALRLLDAKPINLCQGALQHNNKQIRRVYWYQALGSLIGLWFVSFLCLNVFILHRLNHHIALLDQKIATIYHEFFPQAHQVISPVFRVEQRLKEGHSSNDAVFWKLQSILATVLTTSEFTVEQLRFQHQTLTVTLIANDFESLDELQHRLQQAGVTVKQTQAASHEQKVMATLELR